MKTDQLFKLPKLALGKRNEYAIRFNPGGKFHGWMYVLHPDGQWVSIHKLEDIDPFTTNPNRLLTLPVKSEDD